MLLRFLFVLTVILSGCKVDNLSSFDPSSSLQGAAPLRFFDSFAVPEPKPKHILDQIVQSFLNFGRRMGGGNMTAALARKQLQAELIREILARGGVEGNQLAAIVFDLLSDRAGKCAGASCSKILGTRAEDVNALLDETFQLVKNDKRLLAKNQQKNREILLGSLARNDEESFVDEMSRRGFKVRGEAGALTGTCAVATRTSMGLRTKGMVKTISADMNFVRPAVDLRIPGPKRFQGMTASCHMFATTALFEHSPNVEEFPLARKIDLTRSVVDVWSDNLGRNVDDALNNEVKYIKELVDYRTNFVQNAKASLGVTEKQAVDRWRTMSQVPIRNYAQGGYAVADFMRFRTFGAVLADSKNPKITINDIEDMTNDLGQARQNLLESALQKSLTPEEIKDTIRPHIARVFAVRDQNKAIGRVALKDLSNYTMTKVAFDRKNIVNSINIFMSEFKKHGPIAVSRRSHATTVVAYDPEKHLFFIRDSADRFHRDYAEVSEGEFFNSLDNYYVMKKTEEREI